MKKEKIVKGTLTINTKNIIRDYYEGRFDRDSFQLTVTPEEAQRVITEFMTNSNEKLLIFGLHQELAIKMEIIESINFNLK